MARARGLRAGRHGRDLERRGRGLPARSAWRAPTSSIPPRPDAPPEDSSDWFPLSGIGAAGDLVTTPRDLARGFHALFTGQVLDSDALAMLRGPLLPAGFPGTNVTHCGHGVLVSRFGDLTIEGHLGQLRGHVTMAGHHAASGITAVLSQNSCSSDLAAFGATGIHPAFAEVFRLAGA